MDKILTFIFAHLFFMALNAQSFELSIPFNEDSTVSVSGIRAIEDENGEFFLLGLNRRIGGCGPPHGCPIIGSSVFRLSNSGELVWKEVYNEHNPAIAVPVSSRKLIKDHQGRLLLPYTNEIGWSSCEGLSSNTAMLNVDRGMYVINANNGELIEQRSIDPIDDIIECGIYHLIDFSKLNEYYYLHSGGTPHSLYLNKLDTNFNFIERLKIDISTGGISISEMDKTLYYFKEEHFYKLDLEGNTLVDIDMHNEQFYAHASRVVENTNYIALLSRPYQRNGTGVTIISKLTNEIVNQHYFEEDDFIDIALLDNRVLALLNEKYQEDYNRELPFKVVLFDTDFTRLKEKNYGFDATYVRELSLLKDGSGFFVTGSTSQKDESGNSKGVVYFLKDDFTNLEPVYRPMDEAPLGVNVFPNPTSGLVKVLIDPAVSLPLDLRLVSTAGQVMQELEVMEHSLELDLSALPIGVYHLVLESGEESRTEKIVKMW